VTVYRSLPVVKAAVVRARALLGRNGAGAIMRRLPPHIEAGLLATASVLLLVLGLRFAGALETLELMAYDRLVLFRSDGRGTQDRVVQIGITEDDIRRFRWPISDGVLAETIRRLHQAGPVAIGIDIFRPLPIGDGAQSLTDTLGSTPEVVWADQFGLSGSDGVPAPAVIQASRRNGFADFVPDPGGVVRRGLLYLNDPQHREEALSLKLALRYLALRDIRPRPDPGGNLTLGGVVLPPLRTPVGGYASNVNPGGYQVLLEFRGHRRVESFSLASLFDGTLRDARIHGRIALVGWTTGSVKDYLGTPLNALADRGMYGVTLQSLFTAQLLAAGLDGITPTRAFPRATETVLIALMILVGGCGGTLLRNALQFGAAMLAGTLAILAVCAIAFNHGLWLPVLPMASGWILAGLSAAAAITHLERTQRVLLMRLFSAHVSGPIAVELWKRRDEFIRHGRTIPVRLSATVVFADINDFTAASETMEPETVVQWLSPYMDAMTALTERHGGVVERLAGDCIMAMFGAPVVRQHSHEIEADAAAAVRFAMQMRQSLHQLNAAFRAQNLPAMHIGIGIHSGELVSCSLGNAERQQYATIGDTTNVAARVMEVAKGYLRQTPMNETCCIVISEATRILLCDTVDLIPLGPMNCRGKRQPVECYIVSEQGQTLSSSGVRHRVADRPFPRPGFPC
jgi:adenylate cyclase